MSWVFYLLASITVVGALAAMLLRSTVHCALTVTVAFAGMATLFLNLDAEFAGFAQILVYIGAVAILVVFAILLTKGSEIPRDAVFSHTWLVGLAVAAAVFALLAWAVIVSISALPNQAAVPPVTVRQIGEALMSRYVMPLELIGVLLTVATLGAVIVAIDDKSASGKERAR
jgi:NADH-quinone oxidoreductase subunit J